MSYNKVIYVNPTALDECSGSLRLYFHHNPLTTKCNISVETLQHLDVRSEYLVCDTRLLWMKDAAERGVTVVDFTCASPPSLQGRSFNSLTREELAAVGKSQHAQDEGK